MGITILIFLNTNYFIYLVYKFWWTEEFSYCFTVLCICKDTLKCVQMEKLKIEMLEGTALTTICFEV